MHAAHAEVTELVLVGDPGDLSPVAHLACAQLELEVDDVLEGGALAGAGAVSDADEEALALAATHPLDQLVERRRRLRGVVGCADGEAVAVRAETLGLVEAQLRTGRVDQEVVRDSLRRAVRRRLDQHVRGRVAAVSLGVDLPRCGLDELDPVAFVDRSEREHDLGGLHQPDADPDVGRNPVVVRLGRDDRDAVAAAEPPARERGGGVAGNSGAENDDPRHVTGPFIVGSCATAGGAPSVDPRTGAAPVPPPRANAWRPPFRSSVASSA